MTDRFVTVVVILSEVGKRVIMVLRRKVDDKQEELHALRQKSRQGGGASRIENQHAKGKLTAHERIALLFDEDTFEEIDAFGLQLLSQHHLQQM